MSLFRKKSTTKQEAFSEVYKPLHHNLTRFVQNMVWSNEDRKDIINETAMIAYEKFDAIRDKKAMLSFLFTVASRLIYKYRERRDRFRTEEYNHDQLIDEKDSAHVKVEAKELKEALSKLGLKSQEAIVLFEINGMSIIEIAELQKDSVPAVKSRLARARESLRKMFDEKITNEIGNAI
ncbi:MAG TPA: sigma-70 family RNA polymerase sigma factor [Bacteroidia bacterium]|nr:sigma-70 family RNA polymerase sigma factor [Bacteroidia bacterium]HNU32366.1 sigma-70 family RNA polymerase sigma factor [Bacteroidia bacterium]